MEHLGVGVMLANLAGNEDSVKAYEAGLNKQIECVVFAEDAITMKFTDGTDLVFRDEGQSCCESRYMVCDDDLSAFAGATFLGAELLDGPEPYGRDDVYEVQFLHIATSRGKFTVSNHNEHNGYYGGFAIRCSTTASAPA